MEKTTSKTPGERWCKNYASEMLARSKVEPLCLGKPSLLGSPPQYMMLRFIFCTKKAISIVCKNYPIQDASDWLHPTVQFEPWGNAEKNRKILACLIMFSNTCTFSRIGTLLTKLHALKIYFTKIPYFLPYSRRKEKKCIHSYSFSLSSL